MTIIAISMVMGARRGGGAAGAYTAAYAANSIDPELVVDFASDFYAQDSAASTFGDLLTFSRASSATYVDSSGVLQTVSSGVARTAHHKWNGSAWVNKGLLLESEARTNLITHSEDFTDASWTEVNSTATLNAVGPDGVSDSAATINDDNSGGSNVVQIAIAAVTGLSTSTAYTLSALAKADQLPWLYFELDGFTTPASNTRAFFNLSTGAKGTIDAALDSANIENVGNDWYRCPITFTTDVTDDAGTVRIGVSGADSSLSVDRDGTSSILSYGAQFEQVSTVVPYASSYIPTNGSSQTRAAETLSIAAADMPASTSDYSLSAHMGIDRAAGQEMILADWRVDANNRITVKVNTSNAVVLEHVRSGTVVTVTGGTISGGQNIACNWAIRITPSAANIAVNGTAATEASVGGIIDLSSADLDIGGTAFMGTLEGIAIWGADIDQAGVEVASTGPFGPA
jgi:hypothetical protein